MIPTATTTMMKYSDKPSWMYTEPEMNEERSCYTVGETEHYFVDIVPMLFNNHRIVLTPREHTEGYDVGWCYPSALAAGLAVLNWDDPDRTEPIGAIKRVGPLGGTIWSELSGISETS